MSVEAETIRGALKLLGATAAEARVAKLEDVAEAALAVDAEFDMRADTDWTGPQVQALHDALVALSALPAEEEPKPQEAGMARPKPHYMVKDDEREQGKRDALNALWTALEKIRLHGSPWWRDVWAEPAALAHDALNEANRLAPGGILDESTGGQE